MLARVEGVERGNSILLHWPAKAFTSVTSEALGRSGAQQRLCVRQRGAGGSWLKGGRKQTGENNWNAAVREEENIMLERIKKRMWNRKRAKDRSKETGKVPDHRKKRIRKETKSRRTDGMLPRKKRKIKECKSLANERRKNYAAKTKGE